MKIAFIYDAVYPWVKGGAEKRVYELAKRLALRGHEVHWYSIGWWWTENDHTDIVMESLILLTCTLIIEDQLKKQLYSV